MYEKINYTLVGIFVIIATALLTYFGIWLAKESGSKDTFNRYYCYFSESVDGLTQDSVVKLNGVSVGRLQALQLDTQNPSLIKATLNINKNIRITKDMYAILQSQGLTGLRYINIEGGKSKDFIEPNSKDSIIKTKLSLVSKLSTTTPELLEKLSNFTNQLNKTFSDKNIEGIEEIINNTNEITKSLKTTISDSNSSNIKTVVAIVKDLNQTLTTTLLEYKKLAKNGNITLKIINKKVPNLITNIDKSAKELTKVSKLIQRSIKRGDYNLKKILQPAVVDLKELSISYKELSDELQSIAQDPSGAIFNGTKPPKGPGE